MSELGSPINFSGDLPTSANPRTKKVTATRPKKLQPIRQPIRTCKDELGKSSRGAFQAFRQRKANKNMKTLSPIPEVRQKTYNDSNTSLSGLKTPPPRSLQLLSSPLLPPPAPKKERPGRLKPLDRGIKTKDYKNTSLLFSLDH